MKGIRGMKILVYGAGVIGGDLTHVLCAAENHVTLLARGKWRKTLERDGLFRLAPYLCALDTLSIDWMGGAFYRIQTLATGGDRCDFYICKKGSKWDTGYKEGGSSC